MNKKKKAKISTPNTQIFSWTFSEFLLLQRWRILNFYIDIESNKESEKRKKKQKQKNIL